MHINHLQSYSKAHSRTLQALEKIIKMKGISLRKSSRTTKSAFPTRGNVTQLSIAAFGSSKIGKDIYIYIFNIFKIANDYGYILFRSGRGYAIRFVNCTTKLGDRIARLPTMVMAILKE